MKSIVYIRNGQIIGAIPLDETETESPFGTDDTIITIESTVTHEVIGNYYFDEPSGAIIAKRVIKLTQDKNQITDDGIDEAVLHVNSDIPLDVKLVYLNGEEMSMAKARTIEPVDGVISITIKSMLMGQVGINFTHPHVIEIATMIEVI